MPRPSASQSSPAIIRSHRKLPVSSISRRKVVRYTAQQLEDYYTEAVVWVQENPRPSGRPNYVRALKIFPMLEKSTLSRRCNKKTRSHLVAHENQMRISRTQEEILGEWMAKDGREGFGWSRTKLKDRVRALTGTIPSNQWIRGFEKRQAEQVRIRKPRLLDTTRAKCFNPTTVKQHFEEYDRIRKDYRLVYNFDETGRQSGGGRGHSGRKYYMAAGDKAHYKQSDGNLELITVMEACCNDGTMLDPGFIFSGAGTYSSEWFEGPEVEGRKISIGLTPSGWTSDEQCCLWFEKVFVPQVRAKALSDDERILLVFDGHRSHLTDELFGLATQYNIDFYLLPPHTTHKLQPLDVGCFGPMQRRWIDRCHSVIEKTTSRLDRGAFIRQYLEVRKLSITEEVIKAAWRKSGLDPFNPNIFSADDFAPSHAFSSQSHLPPSFPQGTLPESDIDPAEEEDSMVVDSDETAASAVDESHASSSQGPGTVTDDQAGNTLVPSHHSPRGNLPSFARTKIPSDTTLAETVSLLCQDLDRLEGLYQDELTRRVRAEDHCTHAGFEIETLKSRLAEKDKKQTRKTKQFASKATFLMGEDAVRERERLREEKEQKEADDASKQAEQESREREDQERRSRIAQDPEHEFTGSLKSKKKVELQDIAFTLGLSMKATNEKLAATIRERLLSAPRYREERRYKKLFTSAFVRDGDMHPLANEDPEATAQPAPSSGLPEPVHASGSSQAIPASRPRPPVIDPTITNESAFNRRQPEGNENIHPPGYPSPSLPQRPLLPRSPLYTAGHDHPFLNHASGLLEAGYAPYVAHHRLSGDGEEPEHPQGGPVWPRRQW